MDQPQPHSRPTIFCQVVDLPTDGHIFTGTPESTAPSTPQIPSAQTLTGRSSPVPSVLSANSLTLEQQLITIDGRRYSATGLYPFPFDPENLQHDRVNQYLKLVLKGNICLGPVDKILADDGSKTPKAILDLGCGAGDWGIEMALKYPHCEVVGVDLVPIIEKSLPPNFRMEVDDINLGLEHFYGQFDLVHCQAIASGIKNYGQLIDQISHILRPGGMISISEFDYRPFDSNGRVWHPQPRGHPDHSWLPIFGHTLYKCLQTLGANPDAVYKIVPFIQENGAFEHLGADELLLPLHPWYPNPTTQEEFVANIIGGLQSRSLHEVSTRQVFGASGLSEEEIAELFDGAQREVRTAAGRFKVAVRLHFTWARKKEDDTEVVEP